MIQREKYNIEFYWYIDDRDGEKIPSANIRMGSKSSSSPLGGVHPYYLYSIISRYRRISMIDSLLDDVIWGISNPTSIDDSYDLDDGSNLFIHDGKFTFGWGDNPTDPENNSIPLIDFRDLLLEWKDFISKSEE